jgi:hypothetical protein
MKKMLITITIVFLSLSMAFGDVLYMHNDGNVEAKNAADKKKHEKLPANMRIGVFSMEDVLHNSYGLPAVEEQLKKEQIEKKKESPFEKDSEYTSWKEQMNRADGKRKTGLVLIIAGLAAVGGGAAAVMATKESGPERAGSYYFPSEFNYQLSVQHRNYYDFKWYSIALLSGGAATAIYGLFVRSSGDNMKKDLEEEGKRKGYLTLNVNPYTEQINIAYKIEF